MAKQKPIKKVLIILSGCAFLVSTGAFLFRMVGTSGQQSSTTQGSEQEQVDPLEIQEQGYEKVLEREPENQFALQNLAQIRLEMQNFQGAIEPLEKLRELAPEDSSVLQTLFQVQIQSNQPQKALQTLEKLIELNPEQEEYKTLLATFKQQISSPDSSENQDDTTTINEE